MENKINVAKLLNNCPKGMELDCTMYNKVSLLSVDDREDINFPIRVAREDGNYIALTKYGQYTDASFAKCVIFPKGKTTWEGFQRPFKDGDVLFVDCSDEEDDKLYQYIFILYKPEFNDKWHAYCFLDGVGYFESKETYLTDDEYHPRFATEEEKKKLFDAIKANGYKWNAETKTLEKLRMFEVGDRVRLKSKPNYVYTIHSLTWDDNNKLAYRLLPDNDKHLRVISLIAQNEYELIPNKFDITTLNPFESRVLVRDGDCGEWRGAFWGYLREKRYMKYDTSRGVYRQCIPYEGNEYLLGTTDDCNDYYKNWE